MSVTPNICELNLIGTGGGYGESVVAHLGNNNWMVVDSCQEKGTGTCLPLSLLREKNVALENVKLIVCTHWHNDHIKGLSNLLSECPKAKFAFARANDKEKFFRFIIYDNEHKDSYNNSSTNEFIKCLEAVIDQDRCIRAKHDMLLYANQFASQKVRVYSLSPSNQANIDFDAHIGKLLQEFSASNIRTPSLTPNDKSVALLLEVGEHNILLGADLEVRVNDLYGWLNITRKSTVFRVASKCNYFKIPHHGSENGYHNEIWNRLLEESPIGSITPYNSSNLPRKEMLEKYHSLTSSLHLTSMPKEYRKPKKRDHQDAKAIKYINDTVREIPFNYGVVSSTIDITDKNSSWETKIEGYAIHHN